MARIKTTAEDLRNCSREEWEDADEELREDIKGVIVSLVRDPVVQSFVSNTVLKTLMGLALHGIDRLQGPNSALPEPSIN